MRIFELVCAAILLLCCLGAAGFALRVFEVATSAIHEILAVVALGVAAVCGVGFALMVSIGRVWQELRDIKLNIKRSLRQTNTRDRQTKPTPKWPRTLGVYIRKAINAGGTDAGTQTAESPRAKRFKLIGTDAESGLSTELVIEAADRAEAKLRGAERGITVDRVLAMGD